MLILAVLVFVAPLRTHASTNTAFEVSGWIPYWRAATGTADVMPNLDKLTEIDLFAYTLKSDGTLKDNAGLDQDPWASLITAAKAKKVRVIVTVMTSNTSLIHSLLSDATSRVALEDRIANMVKTNGFDGVDIDFEGKSADDKDNFSLFLKGLYQRMGTKWLMCDIESRTPVDARYYGSDIPPDATVYANDFAQINKYCDRVRLMTYDQQGIDQQLASSAASSSQLYAPVADPLWVQKVIELAKKNIAPSKLAIGVPTYGYEYEVTAYAGGQYMYDIMWTFNPGYAKQIMDQYHVGPPVRNSAGEMQLTYFTTSSTTPTTLSGQMNALVAATAASAYADSLNSHQSFRLLDWPDATSVAQKVALAKQLGVRGVAIFKLDGGEDPNMWGMLADAAGSRTTVLSSPTEPVAAITGSALTRGLDIGAVGSDVRTLQRILNADPDTRIASAGTGSPGHESTYFGPATASAVKKFQLKYGLAKAGSAGYGYVGPTTRAKLNALLGSL